MSLDKHVLELVVIVSRYLNTKYAKVLMAQCPLTLCYQCNVSGK